MPVNPGDHIRHAHFPNWGDGVVVGFRQPTSVLCFFTNGGRRILALPCEHLLDRTPLANAHPVLREAARHPLADWNRAHHHVYAIELRPTVLNNTRFRDRNPQAFDPAKCVYVGVTGLTPQERFLNHQRGHQSSYYPHEFGVRLRPDLYGSFNPMPYGVAALVEPLLAESLRGQGYGVWQN